MQDIQEIFIRIQENKKKQKDLRSSFADALKISEEYKEVCGKLETLKARKKQIEAAIRADFASELTKLDDIKIDLESDMVILTDAALTLMMKGGTVEVKDQYENKYEPSWTVKFKKT